MQIEKAQFQANLELLQKCSSPSQNEDISDKVMFHKDGMANASRGRLFTYLEGSFDFEGVFNLDNLTKIVRAMPGDIIEINFIEDELKISASKTKLDLTLIPIDNFKEKYIEKAFAYFEGQKFRKLPETFKEGLKMVARCASNVKGTIMSNVAVLSEFMVASDNYKIGHYVLKHSFQKEFLLDTYNIQPILDFNPFMYLLMEDRIIFMNLNNDYQMCAINQRGKYPDFSDLIQNLLPEQTVIFPDEMSQCIDLAQLLPGKNPDTQMKISVSKNKMALSCKTSSGRFSKNLRIDYSGPIINMAMNLDTLGDVLKNMGHSINISSTETGIVQAGAFSYLFPVEIVTE